ncbi:IVNS1ABP [Mytilus edulis]|uniref:IVNS1ABP n=1 Tax=Mytilus edulis TaxID=6550 RepID=A0A8S3Q360_MYTED|nr:IVNS1ABP [Mytilus edulis]
MHESNDWSQGLGVRRFAVDDDLREKNRPFIQNNINTVTCSKLFFGLSTVLVEIIGADEELIEPSNSHHMAELVLNWARDSIDTEKPRLDNLLEQVNILYLNKDNTLTDFKDINDERTKEEDDVREYKCIKKRHETPQKDPVANVNSPMNGTVLKFNINPENPISPKEWLAHSPPDSGSEAPDSPTTNGMTLERAVSLTPLASMTVPRCGFGLKVVNNKLFACDEIYAVGGSNGQIEQKTVECYNYETNKWSTISEVAKAKVSQALVCVDNKLYCIGGCVGPKSVPDCEVYDPESKSWSKIAPLNTGRYQIAACYHKGLIYAIGGTDGWNVLGITEVYDIKTDKWVMGPSLNVVRRGAGCDIVNGKIHVVGGSDGSNSLKSVEILDNNNFILGSTMSIGRANVGVVSFNNRLYAVGGFSGKKFLDTFEYLDPKSEEWCSYVPAEEVQKAMKNGNAST